MEVKSFKLYEFPVCIDKFSFREIRPFNLKTTLSAMINLWRVVLFDIKVTSCKPTSNPSCNSKRSIA